MIAAKKLTVYWDNLTEESWNAGTRKVNCNLAALLPDRSGFAPVTGSVQGRRGGRRQAAPPAASRRARHAGRPPAPRAAAGRPRPRPGAGAPPPADAGRRPSRRARPRRRRRRRRRASPTPPRAEVSARHAGRRADDPPRFEELVAEALDTIPPELAAAMDNVVVLVEDRNPERARPARAVRGRRADRAHRDYGGVLPDRITIYQDAILDICATRTRWCDEVAITVVHEVAHHFGIDEEHPARARLGLSRVPAGRRLSVRPGRRRRSRRRAPAARVPVLQRQPGAGRRRARPARCCGTYAVSAVSPSSAAGGQPDRRAVADQHHRRRSRAVGDLLAAPAGSASRSSWADSPPGRRASRSPRHQAA